ncbi:hypothetical protein [Cytobacillus oceanisediminis]|uniref:hypothetical protein n=1 Tax=Cytobacillus oceanisediminis TaxID=665099 RepID=UPI00203C538A|nr:hypothetical protein [Cytobacillus oceanisediminis]MCM3405941.1 hypothetical protein [Cytobacillus oceanisediminis]
MMKEIKLTETSIKSAVRLMMEETEYKQFQEVATALEIPKSTFQSALDNNSMRVRDLQKVADLLGYEIKLERK